MGAGSRAASSVPLLMLLALVVSVVADATKPLICDVGIVGNSASRIPPELSRAATPPAAPSILPCSAVPAEVPYRTEMVLLLFCCPAPKVPASILPEPPTRKGATGTTSEPLTPRLPRAVAWAVGPKAAISPSSLWRVRLPEVGIGACANPAIGHNAASVMRILATWDRSRSGALAMASGEIGEGIRENQ